MQQSLFGKDKIFFTMALSKLLNKPIHGYVRSDKVNDKLIWSLTIVFCEVSADKVLCIDGLKSRKEIDFENKGNMKLTTNNYKHLLEFIEDQDSEIDLDLILKNYTTAILDTYGDFLGKTKIAKQG